MNSITRLKRLARDKVSSEELRRPISFPDRGTKRIETPATAARNEVRPQSVVGEVLEQGRLWLREIASRR